MTIVDILSDNGINPIAIGVALVAIISVILFMQISNGASTPEEGKIELHPEHVKYMKSKEEEHCSSSFGKGLRCIIDFLREEDDEIVEKIFAEKPKYTEGFEVYDISVHPPQFEWLEQKGIKISTEKGEEYKELSRVSRACFDWAMRKEAEGDNQDYTLFEYVRCLNC